jgi:predicted dehydrogenase
MFMDEMRSFLGAARHEHPPEVDLAQAIATQQMAEAFRISLESGSLQSLS